MTTGTRLRRIPREEAKIAIACLRDWGVSAGIIESAPDKQPAPQPNLKPAA